MIGRLYRHELIVAGIALAFIMVTVAGLRSTTEQLGLDPSIELISLPAIEVHEVEFAADAARITYASINGEQVASGDTYPAVAGDHVVLTIVGADPRRIATCGIVIDGTAAEVEHTGYRDAATCEVILP